MNRHDNDSGTCFYLACCKPATCTAKNKKTIIIDHSTTSMMYDVRTPCSNRPHNALLSIILSISISNVFC